MISIFLLYVNVDLDICQREKFTQILFRTSNFFCYWKQSLPYRTKEKQFLTLIFISYEKERWKVCISACFAFLQEYYMKKGRDAVINNKTEIDHLKETKSNSVQQKHIYHDDDLHHHHYHHHNYESWERKYFWYFILEDCINFYTGKLLT